MSCVSLPGQVVFVVCSTTGDGVPPTDAREWLEDLVAKDRCVPSPRAWRFRALADVPNTIRSSYDLAHLRFSVLALGDSNYTHYCKTGRTIEATLEGASALGTAL